MTASIRNPQVKLLCLKAGQDESALSFDLPDEIYGFHAQQSCEKLFKALINAHGVRFERDHSLRRLTDALLDCGEALPGTPFDLILLDPFAVRFRYDIGSISKVDRSAIGESVVIIRRFVISRILELEQQLVP